MPRARDTLEANPRARRGGTVFRIRRVVVVGIAVLVALVPAATAHAALTPISSDPFTNADSQHLTAVEPDTLSQGSVIVAASQLGRYFDGGSSGIGFSRSVDAGAHWSSGGILPFLTNNDAAHPGAFDRA